MNDTIYKEFVSSVYKLGDLNLSEEMFQEKQEKFNQWLISLEEEQRQRVIEQIMSIIIQVTIQIEDKLHTFKELIFVNEGMMKANSHYDRF